MSRFREAEGCAGAGSDEARVQLVADAVRKIVSGANEAVAKNLRPDLVQYSGSADVHFVYGNRKFGIEYVGIKRDPGVVASELRTVTLVPKLRISWPRKPCVSTMTA